MYFCCRVFADPSDKIFKTSRKKQREITINNNKKKHNNDNNNNKNNRKKAARNLPRLNKIHGDGMGGAAAGGPMPKQCETVGPVGMETTHGVESMGPGRGDPPSV